MNPIFIYSVCYILSIGLMAFLESLWIPGCSDLYEILALQYALEDVDWALVTTIQIHCFPDNVNA